MNTYEPKFIVTERNGKLALWVKMPNGRQYNIWDVTKSEATEDVLKTIESAFSRGMEAYSMIASHLLFTRPTSFYSYDKEENWKKEE